jgi:hypothetical protein
VHNRVPDIITSVVLDPPMQKIIEVVCYLWDRNNINIVNLSGTYMIKQYSYSGYARTDIITVPSTTCMTHDFAIMRSFLKN